MEHGPSSSEQHAVPSPNDLGSEARDVVGARDDPHHDLDRDVGVTCKMWVSPTA